MRAVLLLLRFSLLNLLAVNIHCQQHPLSCLTLPYLLDNCVNQESAALQIPQVLDAIQLSHATFNKIRQNLWWAFGYNLVGIPLAAGALLPSMGIALTPSLSGEHSSEDSINPVLVGQ